MKYFDMTEAERKHFHFFPGELTVRLYRRGYLVLGQSLVLEGLVIIEKATGIRFHASFNSIFERLAKEIA